MALRLPASALLAAFSLSSVLCSAAASRLIEARGLSGAATARSVQPGAELEKFNLWDDSVPSHAIGKSAFLPLRRQLVDILGIEFKSEQWFRAQAQEARRRLASFNSASKAAAAGDDLALLDMGGSVVNGTFYTAIGIGTPQQELHLTFDTGSSIMWTNCDCISCPEYSNVITLTTYRPESSNTSKTVGCDSQCSEFKGTVLATEFCEQGTCQFQVRYGDGSRVDGPVVEDYVAFPSSARSGGYIGGKAFFGCGRNQSGLLLHPNGALDGLLGMGQSGNSILFQLANDNVLPAVFSFCLDSEDSQGSHALFGRGPVPKSLLTTPLVDNPNSRIRVSYYYIQLSAIRVGNDRVQGSAQIQEFDSLGAGGVIVDSGTTLTNLPYNVFTDLITKLSDANPNTPFTFDSPDQPYPCTVVPSPDVSVFPDIVMEFPGGLEWNVKPSSYLLLLGYGPFGYKYCLGVMSQSAGLPAAIIGESWLTDTFVVVDTVKGTFGWANMNCTSGDYFMRGQTAVAGGDFTSSTGSGSPATPNVPGINPGNIGETIIGWFKAAPRRHGPSQAILAIAGVIASSIIFLI